MKVVLSILTCILCYYTIILIFCISILNSAKVILSFDTKFYYGLNNFKLGFKADIFESIGEYDLVFNSHLYKRLISSGKLAQAIKKDL